MSNITLEEIRTELAGFVQDTVDALGYANYGSDYKGKWAAGDYDVETVVSHSLRFYSSLVARTATDTADPSLDTAAWKLLGSAATIRGISQDNVDALGNSTYGSLYKGLWAAGVHAAGEYRSSGGRYYRCKTDRTASDTDSPPMDEAGWEVVGSSFVVQGDIETAKQENIDTAADLVFGSSYRGKWERASYDPGDVVYDEAGKGFYECDIARTQRNRNPPSVNTSHWSRVDPLNKVVKDSKGLARTRSQVFTESGNWVKPRNVDSVRVKLVGGGGGGGGAGGVFASYNNHATSGGGGGGASGELIVDEVLVTGDVEVTIGEGGEGGAGGVGNQNGFQGGNGGDTSFGTHLTAKGGSRGNNTAGGSSNQLSYGGSAGHGAGQNNLFGIGSVSGGHGGGGVSSSSSGHSVATPVAGVSHGLGIHTEGGSAGIGARSGRRGGGGGGGGAAGIRGNGGDGGNGIINNEGNGRDGESAEPNSGAGGGGGGGAYDSAPRTGVGTSRNGGSGGRGGSGYAVVYWTE